MKSLSEIVKELVGDNPGMKKKLILPLLYPGDECMVVNHRTKDKRQEPGKVVYVDIRLREKGGPVFLYHVLLNRRSKKKSGIRIKTDGDNVLIMNR